MLACKQGVAKDRFTESYLFNYARQHYNMVLALLAWLGTQVRVGSAKQFGVVNVYSKFGNNLLGVLTLKQCESRFEFEKRLLRQASTWMPFGTLPHKYLKVEMCSKFEDCKFESLECLEAGKGAYKVWVFWDVKSALDYLVAVHTPSFGKMYYCETRTLCLGMKAATRVAPEVCVYSEATQLRVHGLRGQCEFDLASLPCLKKLVVEDMHVKLLKLPPSLVELVLENATLLNAVPDTVQDVFATNVYVDHTFWESLPKVRRLGVIIAKLQVDVEFLNALAGMTLEALSLERITLNNLDKPFSTTSDLVSCICKLANLTYLRVQDSKLHGKISSELCNLGLTELCLSGNCLTGTIPTELGCCLERLSLHNNNLCGTIPTQLGRVVTLKNLDLGNNYFCGTIPSELGLLVRLEGLWLGDNNLCGKIPTHLGQLTTLDALELSTNQLCGQIPSELGLLVNVRVLALQCNRLSGTIPTELGLLVNVRVLALQCNRLSGTIPTELGLLTRLEHLHLQENRFSGAFPGQLVRLGFEAEDVLHYSY